MRGCVRGKGFQSTLTDNRDILSQRFDRFYLSPDIQKEVEAAKNYGGLTDDALVDSLQEEAAANYEDFSKKFSDHCPVVLCVDVSEER